MRVSPARSRCDLGDGLPLGVRQTEGEGALDFLGEQAIDFPGGAATAFQAGAHERERELVRRKLVEGKPLPGGTGRAGPFDGFGVVHVLQCLGERWPARAP